MNCKKRFLRPKSLPLTCRNVRRYCGDMRRDGAAPPKNFRLHQDLRTQFEAFCREHLLDERSVVEAWILRFLETSDAERQGVAKRYAEWVSEQQSKAGAPGKKPRSPRS